MEVQIISRETISSLSTPTDPHRANSLKLSLLDHLATSNYVTIILFYPSSYCGVGNQEDHMFKRSDKLKRSLSKNLTHFYPVAGRIRDGTAVDCGDQGVEFLEAKASIGLAEFLKHPDIDDLDKLLPCVPSVTNEELLSKALLEIQVTYFDCGGMALGVCFSHKIADGASMAMFIKSWAEAANGSSGSVLPSLSFDLPSLFPATEDQSDGSTPRRRNGRWNNIVARRFIFDGEKIAAIRGAIAAETGNEVVEHPTRVEAVSGFIWERVITATRAKGGHERASIALHAMNLRGRMVPPQPCFTFGNASRPTITQCVKFESDTACHVLVKHLRDAIRRVDGDYVRKLQCGEEGFMNSIEETMKQFSKEEVLAMNFNSWCRFPFYEADFGWGKPIWVSTTKTPGKNLVILIDSKFGDGIEAWLNMVEEDMVELEKDEEFLSFVSI
ncbi:hypothetical protein Syun_000370 [Stephania yunnanensis]|uniref:Vinorine synthase-like n=2 Tax=Stephania TaxID=147243 RepID=A0AAP0LCZ2_9MAGN